MRRVQSGWQHVTGMLWLARGGPRGAGSTYLPREVRAEEGVAQDGRQYVW